MSKRRSGLNHHKKAYSCCNKVKCIPTTIQLPESVQEGITPTGDYSMYQIGYVITWEPIPNGTVYLITQPGVSPQAFEILTPTSANFYANDPVNTPIEVYAHIPGCPDVSGSLLPCFFEDAIVTMSNGSTKMIKDVIVGDMVLGAFGEHNQVIALHRPLLGNGTMTNINNDHHTSSHHPHISMDKQFYSVNPVLVISNTYGKTHTVLDENMVPYERFLSGLNPERINQMELGVQLKTVEGSKEVTYLETYEMAPDTQLYNLVVSGSHTYYVDGYAVTGWPNEDDFNYDMWKPK
jgi:hypothetical protein